MILGSHNTFSHNKATTFVQNLIRSTWQCQEVDYRSQYNYNVRCFDFRLHYQKGKWEAAHGGAHFKVNFEEALNWLNARANSSNKIYIRVLFESGTKGGENAFISTCRNWENKYKNLIFFCGRKKSGWGMLYNFKGNSLSLCQDANIEQYVSSMQEKSALKKIQPKKYAEKNNKSNYNKAKGLNKICLFDYVNKNLR